MSISEDKEVLLVCDYVRYCLSRYECIDLHNISKDEVRKCYDEAVAILKSLRDLESQDGGYYYHISDVLRDDLDAQQRIGMFVDKCESIYLEFKGEECLGVDDCAPEEKICARHDSNYDRYSLEEYLLSLNIEMNNIDIEKFSYRKNDSTGYGLLVGELILYMKYILGDGYSEKGIIGNNAIFLIRDTLLLYLGVLRLKSKGWDVYPVPMLLNRDVLKYFSDMGPGQQIYEDLFDVLFESISPGCKVFSGEFIKKYRENLIGKKDLRITNLIEFIESKISKISDANGRENIIIENGMYGNMPLLLMSIINSDKLYMYTAVPWLQEFYSSSIYTKSYVFLRDIENIYCQDKLFYFDSISDGEVFVRVAQDTTIVKRSYAEMCMFLNAVDDTFPDK